MNYEIRPIAGQVRRHMDSELRALRSRDVWAYVTAVWPLLDRVLARWVAFVTPEMPMPEGSDTVLRDTIRRCVLRTRQMRDLPEYQFDSKELYAAIVGTFVGCAPLLSRMEATLPDGSSWDALQGPLGLRTRLAEVPTFRWHLKPINDGDRVAAAILDAISDELTRPLTVTLIERIRKAA